jgi:hypothetical protein
VMYSRSAPGKQLSKFKPGTSIISLIHCALKARSRPPPPPLYARAARRVAARRVAARRVGALTGGVWGFSGRRGDHLSGVGRVEGRGDPGAQGRPFDRPAQQHKQAAGVPRALHASPGVGPVILLPAQRF